MSFFHNCTQSGPSLSPPPTPQRSGKRGRDEFEDQHNTMKKTQMQQIHSEAHLSTVQMMMEASKSQKNFPMSVDTDEAEDTEHVFRTTQKPFWPIVTRARDA